MPDRQLKLTVLPDTFAVCQLTPEAALPDWAVPGEFLSTTRTADELSIVCSQKAVPTDVKCEGDWRCLQIAGTLDFSLIGILAALATLLAEAGISIFVISTFATDYLLIKAHNLET